MAPVMLPTAVGAEPSVNNLEEGVPLPQAFVGVTVIFPEALPIVTVIEFVPAPAVIDAPAGSTHEYPLAPAAAATLYTKPVCPGQGAAEPVMPAAAAGTDTGIIIAKVELDPAPQALEGVTVIFPEVEPIVTVIEAVFAPAVITVPAGKAHVYVGEPESAGVLYETPADALHISAGPLMLPAARIVFTVTLTEFAVPFPQPLVGVTDTVPDTVPIVAVMLRVFVPCVIVLPAGNTHI